MKKFIKEWGILTLVVIIAVILITVVVYAAIRDHNRGVEEKTYCGNIIDMGYDPPSSGYKSHQDAQYWVVIRDEDVNIAIRVNVTPANYYCSFKGKNVCFTLSALQIYWYGNTNEPRHLK